MQLAETILFYLLIGAGVSVAALIVDDARAPGERVFRAATALLFWPLYLPILLQQARPVEQAAKVEQPSTDQTDEFAVAIAQVEVELDTALNSLGGWAEDALSGEQGRLAELRAAWRLQAERIRELDRLLTQPEFLDDVSRTEGELPRETPAGDVTERAPDRSHLCTRARQENIDRLKQLRRQMNDDLMGTLSWVRELVTMIHLAKFTGAPASRAQELVAQIAAAVEGLSEVSTWQEEPLVSV
jgi:hypothetical protein